MGRFWATLIVSVLGVGLSAFPGIVHGYSHYVGVLGYAFAPIAAVLLVDYLLVKRTRIDIAALFERGGPYWYWGGFNVLAILWVVTGFLFCALFVPTGWVPTMVALLLTGIGYYVTVLLVAPRSHILGEAARPGERLETPEQLDEVLALKP
jgi:cytosine/uracil/thiamine/allantoin permease